MAWKAARQQGVRLGAQQQGAGEKSAAWDESQRRSALRSYERVIRAIEAGEAEQARSVMAASLAAALRGAERLAPDQLKRPVAWIASRR